MRFPAIAWNFYNISHSYRTVSSHLKKTKLQISGMFPLWNGKMKKKKKNENNIDVAPLPCKEHFKLWLKPVLFIVRSRYSTQTTMLLRTVFS